MDYVGRLPYTRLANVDSMAAACKTTYKKDLNYYCYGLPGGQTLDRVYYHFAIIDYSLSF